MVGLVDDVVVVDEGDVETWHLMRAGVIEEMCVVDGGNGEGGGVGGGVGGGGGACMEGEIGESGDSGDGVVVGIGGGGACMEDEIGEEEEERGDAPGVGV